ncbi:MAG: Mur ligase family protein, partial [Candidatus Dojkabacteria bacterium]
MKIPGLQKLKNIFHLYQARKAQKKFAQPQLQLVNLGITGTDGKTTTTGIVYHILQNSGLKSGYLSSTAAKIGKKELDTGFHVTSPDPWMVPQYLRMMLDEGVEYAVLETTSQGLDQNRFGDIRFDGAIITNIREDHLDYHGTWENYAKAKFRLVEKLKPGGVVILNAEDERSAKWLYERV